MQVSFFFVDLLGKARYTKSKQEANQMDDFTGGKSHDDTP